MFSRIICTAALTGLLLVSACAGADVTLIGNVLNNTHTGDREKGVYIYAFDGRPEVKAAAAKIFADIPDKGLDADGAVKVQDEFTQQLKYTITGPKAEKLRKDVEYGSKILAVSGTIEEHDGAKFLVLSKYEPAQYTYPAKLLAADKPLVAQGKEPIELKLGGNLSIKCVYIPPGKFLMGAPYYQWPRWEEEPPHIVTLTRGFYIGETDVSQEQFEAVMGNNPSDVKDPKFPVNNLDYEQMMKFCRALWQKTGKTIRLATAAEWEYAARAGTSNPTFTEKHARLNSAAAAGYTAAPLAVKSRDPNGWGLYDLCAGSWELVSDGTGQIDRQPTTDPTHIPEAENGAENRAAPQDHMGKGNQNYPISEIEFIHPANGKMLRFRVIIEAEAGN